MFKRIKRMWALSNKDAEALSVLEGLTEEQLKEVPEAKKGDGKAVFLGEGTHEEFIEQERKDKGMSGWYRRIRNL